MKEGLRIFGHSGGEFIFVLESPHLPFSEHYLFIQPAPGLMGEDGHVQPGSLSQQLGCGHGSSLFLLGVASRLEYLKMGPLGVGVGVMSSPSQYVYQGKLDGQMTGDT